MQARVTQLETDLAGDRQAGEQMTAALRACAADEAEIQAALRVSGETVTAAEVAAQRLRDQAEEAELELRTVAERLGVEPAAASDREVAPDGQQAEDGQQADDGEPIASGEPTEAPGLASREALGEDEVHALRTRVERLTADASSSDP